MPESYKIFEADINGSIETIKKKLDNIKMTDEDLVAWEILSDCAKEIYRQNDLRKLGISY
jgi:hypothetical protein